MILFEIAKDKGYQYVHDKYGLHNLNDGILNMGNRNESEELPKIEEIKLLDK